MKAYNTQWVVNDAVIKTAQKWFKQGFLTNPQLEEIKKVYTVDYANPNIFLKIGLFVFTILAGSFSGSILAFFIVTPFQDNYNMAFIFQSFIMGIAFVFLLENFIKSHKLYHSGVDNALIYMAVSAFCTTIFMIFENAHLPTPIFLLLFLPLYVIATIRYADAVICTLMYFLSLGIIITTALEWTWGKTLLPFIVMISSAIAHYFTLKQYKRQDFLYYETCLNILKTLSLITFYLGGNYLIVREGNALINNLSGTVSPQIAFAQIFYFFTLMIPVFYIVWGLRKHDRLILTLGLLTTAFSIFTYRYYFSVLPLEIALTVGGFLLVVLAGFAINYFKINRKGYTYQPDSDFEGMNLEALLMSEAIQSKIPQQGDTFRFGGGDAGGGGAGGEY